MSTSHFWADFERLSLWSVQALIIPPLIAMLIICSASFILASIRQRPLRTAGWHVSYWLALTQILILSCDDCDWCPFPGHQCRAASSSKPHGQPLVRWALLPIAGHRLLLGLQDERPAMVRG